MRRSARNACFSTRNMRGLVTLRQTPRSFFVVRFAGWSSEGGKVPSMTIARDDVLVDLIAEYERLEGILRGLTEAQWASPSGTPGWTVTAVVVHLAQTEEDVAATLQQPSDEWHVRDRPLDDAVDDRVLADLAAPSLRPRSCWNGGPQPVAHRSMRFAAQIRRVHIVGPQRR